MPISDGHIEKTRVLCILRIAVVSLGQCSNRNAQAAIAVDGEVHARNQRAVQDNAFRGSGLFAFQDSLTIFSILDCLVVFFLRIEDVKPLARTFFRSCEKSVG